MKPTDHLDMIDAALNQMASEGHFNDTVASVKAGSVQYALSELREELEKNDTDT
jgi:hypothetical protein